MSIFAALTGSASRTAARNNAQAIGAGRDLSADALTQGYVNASGLLGTNGGGSALGQLGAGFGQARNDLTGQYGQTQGYLGQIGASYQPMIQGGGAAYGRYLDATGANGAEGSARATDAFRTGPGYQFQQDQGLDAIARTAAARGGLAGGNATADMLRFSQGLADQSFQQYVGNLGNAAQSYQTGLAGQAAGLTGQANASQQQGNSLAALGTGMGLAGAGIYGQGAGQQERFGQGVAGVQQGAANSMVQNNSALAQSLNQASSNALNLGMNILGTALGLPPGTLSMSPNGGGNGGGASGNGGGNSGGGSFLSSLSNLFR